MFDTLADIGSTMLRCCLFIALFGFNDPMALMSTPSPSPEPYDITRGPLTTAAIWAVLAGTAVALIISAIGGMFRREGRGDDTKGWK